MEYQITYKKFIKTNQAKVALAFIFSQPSDRQADTPFLNPYATTTYMRVFG